MEESERQARRKADVDELHRAIGEFVVAFEHVCHAVTFGMTFLLGNAGLQEQRVTNVLLAGLTAEPLRTLYQSLIGQLVTLNDLERKIVGNIFSRFKSLTEERNDIIHSTWFIGWGDNTTEDFSEASGMKLHKTKDGGSVKNLSKKASDFAALTLQAKELAKLMHRLTPCVAMGKSVERNFVLGAAGQVETPPGT
jgi:hypothetical protein